MAGMTIDTDLGARLSATLAAAMRAGDYGFADYARSVTGELFEDGDLRLKLRAAIAEAEAHDDAARVGQLAEVLRLADEFGLRWADKARQMLGLDKES